MIWSRADLARLAILAFGYPATGLLPRAMDGWAVEALFSVFRRLGRARLRRLAATLRSQFDHLSGAEAVTLAEDYYRFYFEDGWGRLRDLHRRGSEARMELEGREHLDAALAAGRGAVLWVMPFCGSRVPKAAFFQAGIPLAHLTREDHGAPSQSLLALRWLAPLYRRAERRYLAEAIMMPRSGFPGYVRALEAVLAANRCLSITSGPEGRQAVTVRLLRGRARFATGAPALAHATGAALLTVCGRRLGRLHYRVAVGPPIEADRSLPRHEFVRQAVERLAARLESEGTSHPADWQIWGSRPGAWI